MEHRGGWTIEGLIQELRQDEGTSLFIGCPNPDFDGPNESVGVLAEWTDWKERKFTGDTFWHALRSALRAKQEFDQSNRIDRPTD